jgi:3-(3-hydroxy-phenyl)propionate hydroxylase
MDTHDVVIVGAGPTGMMLAAELTLAGVDHLVLDRRDGDEYLGARAGGLHARTIEVLDQRGVAERFLSEGRAMQVQSYAMVPLDISDFPTRHNYGLALWQHDFERILRGWIDELGAPVLRGREVTGFTQDDEGIDVKVSGGRRLRARYLVGCDGGRSLIRKKAGVEFAGWDPTKSTLIAEAEVTEETPRGTRLDESGVHGIHPMEDGRTVRVVVTERRIGPGSPPELSDLRRALVAVWGTDFGVHSPAWISRFTDMTRQATSYRKGRVLLAGDAAHVHYPVGGQGLNTGVQDAVNLGWKLAQVVEGTSPDSLLDTYHDERHPVAARVLRHTMAQTALSCSTPRVDALRESLSELLGMDEPRKRYAAMISGLDIHYDLGEHGPLAGLRMPDLDLETADGATRVFTLLHAARPLLLNFGAPQDLQVRDLASWEHRVRVVQAEHHGPWELPVLGEIDAPPAVVVRPDGHVAWAGHPGDPALGGVIGRWFGAKAPG